MKTKSRTSTAASHYLLLVIHRASVNAKNDVRFVGFEADGEETASEIARDYLTEHNIASANIVAISLQGFNSEASMANCLKESMAALLADKAQPGAVRIGGQA